MAKRMGFMGLSLSFCIASKTGTCQRVKVYTAAMHSFDVVIVGAGAAGLFCAGQAGQLWLEGFVAGPQRKGGRKNPHLRGWPRQLHQHRRDGGNNFLSENPRFAKSALARFTPKPTFVALMHKTPALPFHEKHKGQLFL
jgi:predicted flavoprotein YhiN